MGMRFEPSVIEPGEPSTVGFPGGWDRRPARWAFAGHITNVPSLGPADTPSHPARRELSANRAVLSIAPTRSGRCTNTQPLS